MRPRIIDEKNEPALERTLATDDEVIANADTFAAENNLSAGRLKEVSPGNDDALPGAHNIDKAEP